MRTDAVNRLKATATKIKLGNGDISRTFIRLHNRRDIRKTVVNKLLRVLEEGGHFETPLMTNRVNGKERLLDGNHRIEAIGKYLTKYPERKVEVWIFYYEDLTKDEEREMYTKWNLGTKQNTNDFVKQYWDKIYITKLFKGNFPVKVTPCWSQSSIEFKTLVFGYLGTRSETYTGGFHGSAIDFIEECKKLGDKSFKHIREFMKDYMSVFGNPDKKNMHYKTSVFYSLFRIWMDNLHKKSMTDIQAAFLRVRGHERVVYYSSLGGTRELCQQSRLDLLNAINGKRKSNLFI